MTMDGQQPTHKWSARNWDTPLVVGIQLHVIRAYDVEEMYECKTTIELSHQVLLS